MQVGERAMITMTPAFGFGELGTPSGSRKKSRRSARRLSVGGPTGAFLVFDVHVVGIVDESASAGASIAAGGQHALRDSDAFDELLAKGFVVETKEEGSGKRRPRKGDTVQVKVETYVSLVLCVCACVCVCVCVWCVCVFVWCMCVLICTPLLSLLSPRRHPSAPSF